MSENVKLGQILRNEAHRDVYPWACASGPILVDCQTGSPWSVLYRCGKCYGEAYIPVDPTTCGDIRGCPVCNPDPTGSGVGSKP